MARVRRLTAGRTQSAYENRDGKSATSQHDVIRWGEIGGMPNFYQVKAGNARFDIIPYEIKSNQHPMVVAGKAKIGDLDFMLDLWVHRSIGEGNHSFVCPKKNYGRPCPICKQVSAYYDEGKTDEAKKLQASQRVYLNVRLPDGSKQVFNGSYYLFMRELLEEAHGASEDGSIIEFGDPVDGKTVAFRVEMEKLGQRDVPKFKSFRFLDRATPVTDEDIDDAYSFDAGLILASPEDMEAALYGQPMPGEEAQEEPVPEPEQELDLSDDIQEPEPAPKPIKEQPKPATIKPAKAAPAQEPQGSKCPCGHAWGDADKHPECASCKCWDDCIDAQ